MRGMTLIDVVVGVGVMLTIFLSIFGAYRVAIDLVLNTKARVGGMSLVSERLEYVRGLPYESLGTVGGIPAGTLAQVATTSLNNIEYTIRTLIKYIDDPADGQGAADSNLITADYKEVKVEAYWVIRGRSYSTLALTRVSPHGIESLTSGGTLRVNVFDAVAAPIQGASVRIQNASTSPVVDVTVQSDAGGSVAFPGAPPASNYKITVTKDGYSSAGTYDVTVGNPNPNPGHVSVANQQTTTASFAIDRLGSLSLLARSPAETGTFQDSFANGTLVDAMDATEISGGEIVLTDPGTGYPETGDARSVDISPAYLATWDTLSWTYNAPTDTTVAVQVVYPNGPTYSPVGDGVIPGNSTGLTSGSVSLALVSTSTFPTLALRTILGTANASTTPALLDWKLDYHAGPAPIPDVEFVLFGTKTIGTTVSAAPIYKVVENLTTNTEGVASVSELEWDVYTLELQGTLYDIGTECPYPLSVEPGASVSSELLLYPHTTHSLRVSVTGDGQPLSGATVDVVGTEGGTGLTSSCGQTFFQGLSSETYNVTVSAPGYQPLTQDVPVSGRTVMNIPLVAL